MAKPVRWVTALMGPLTGGLVLVVASLGVSRSVTGQEKADEPQPVGIVKATIFLGEFE